MTASIPRPPLTERLADPETAEVLHRLLDHASTLDQILQGLGELPNLLAIATDFFDAMVRRAHEDGIDLESRATQLVQLLRQLTEPQQMAALQSLVDRLPQLAEVSKHAESLPDLIAIAMDAFDEWAVELKDSGINLEESVRKGLRAALYLGGRIQEDELDKIGFLLRSDVLSEAVVETFDIAGTAMTSCRKGTCEQPVPPKLGLFGALKVLRDPNAQRALSFAMQFAKCFGNELDASHPRPSNNSN